MLPSTCAGSRLLGWMFRSTMLWLWLSDCVTFAVPLAIDLKIMIPKHVFTILENELALAELSENERIAMDNLFAIAINHP